MRTVVKGKSERSSSTNALDGNLVLLAVPKRGFAPSEALSAFCRKGVTRMINRIYGYIIHQIRNTSNSWNMRNGDQPPSDAIRTPTPTAMLLEMRSRISVVQGRYAPPASTRFCCVNMTL